jgi:hypothetical protein
MILQSEENKGVEFTGNGNPRLGCGTNEETKVKPRTLEKPKGAAPPSCLAVKSLPLAKKHLSGNSTYQEFEARRTPQP